MLNHWTSLVTFTGLAFGGIVSIHFLTVKRPGVAIRWLGIYTLILTLSLAEFISEEGSIAMTVLGALTFLYGPSLYLYIRSRMFGVSVVERSAYRHFIPFVLYVLMAGTMTMFQTQTENQEVFEFALYEILFLHIFWYCFAALRLIKEKRNEMPGDNDIVGMQAAFMKTLVICSVLLFSGSFIATHVFIFAGIKIPFEFKYGIQIALCVVIFVIALINTETMHTKKMIKTF